MATQQPAPPGRQLPPPETELKELAKQLFILWAGPLAGDNEHENTADEAIKAAEAFFRVWDAPAHRRVRKQTGLTG